MKVLLTLVVLSLVVMSASEPCWAEGGPEAEGQPQHQNIKRSLCNTFGGCGAKRSIQSGHRNIGAKNDLEISDEDAVFQRKQEANALSITEIVNDLLDYMQTNEKFNRGKYALMVPKSPMANGAAQVSEGDLHELQFGHIYFGRTE